MRKKVSLKCLTNSKTTTTKRVSDAVKCQPLSTEGANRTESNTDTNFQNLLIKNVTKPNPVNNSNTERQNITDHILVHI